MQTEQQRLSITEPIILQLSANRSWHLKQLHGSTPIRMPSAQTNKVLTVIHVKHLNHHALLLVHAGQLFRIVCTEGPQVADVNFWNLHNPKVSGDSSLVGTT